MEILLHTIALEPARWTPRRVSQPLSTLLPVIASAGFREIEVFEPHLGDSPTSPEIRDLFASSGLTPSILSSYLDINPNVTSDATLDRGIDTLSARIAFYGFKKIRLFPGSKIPPSDAAAFQVVTERFKHLASKIQNAEILLETHDGSIADDPAAVVRLVSEIDQPHVGLLFQPTCFKNIDTVWEQIRLQKPYIRHIHLQNRNPDISFSPLPSGIVSWPKIIAELAPLKSATLEFVSSAICTPESFDLAESLAQAKSEAEYAKNLFQNP